MVGKDQVAQILGKAIPSKLRQWWDLMKYVEMGSLLEVVSPLKLVPPFKVGRPLEVEAGAGL